MTKKPIKSLVSAVKTLSAWSSPAMSSAAARIAGATTSRVVFIKSSANHSKTFWICCGFGFCKSATEKLMPMSLMQDAISLSGCEKSGWMRMAMEGVAHQSHERVLLLGATAMVIHGGDAWRGAHARIVVHGEL